MDFLTELSKRWNASSPVFFKKLRQFSNWLSATALAFTGVPAAIEQVAPGVNFDLSILLRISSYMILAGLIINAMTRLPVQDTEDIKKTDEL